MTQLPLWSGTPTVAPFSGNEPPKDGFQTCRCSRETFGCSIHPNTRDEWILFMRGSLALRLASLESGVEQWTNEICGLQPQESLGRFGPDGSFLKTSVDLFQADTGGPSYPTFPASGMMQDGRCWELTRPVPRTEESDGGAWPTPRAGKSTNENEETWKKRRDAGKVSTPPLSLAVRMWPTPRAEHDSGRHSGKPDTLHSAVKMFPTPAARDGRHPHADNSEAFKKRMEHPRGVSLVETIQRENGGVGGTLNPTWVEWLMAWPLGWTVSKVWATAKSRSKRPSRSES